MTVGASAAASAIARPGSRKSYTVSTTGLATPAHLDLLGRTSTALMILEPSADQRAPVGLGSKSSHITKAPASRVPLAVDSVVRRPRRDCAHRFKMVL